MWLSNPKNYQCENTSPSLLQRLCRGLSCSWSLPQTSAEVSAAPKVDNSNCQSRSILNAPPSLQVLSGARDNALAESESTCKAPGGAGSIWKYLEALVRATGVSGRFAYDFQTKLHFADVWVWLSQSTSIMDNRSSPTIWMIFNCNYINNKGGNRQINRQ